MAADNETVIRNSNANIAKNTTNDREVEKLVSFYLEFSRVKFYICSSGLTPLPFRILNIPLCALCNMDLIYESLCNFCEFPHYLIFPLRFVNFVQVGRFFN